MTSNSSDPIEAQGLALSELWRAACAASIELADYRLIPDLAAKAVADGLDAPALYQLAALSQDADQEDIQILLRETLLHLGYKWPTPNEARHALLELWLSDISTGRLAPYDGARLVWKRLFWSWSNEDTKDIAQLVGLASDWEDYPSQRAEIDVQLIAAARSIKKTIQEHVRIQRRPADTD